MAFTLIHALRLVDGTGKPSLADGAVLVEGDRIAFVGSMAEVLSRCPQPDHIIDAGDRTLLPGMIDAHVHLTGFWDEPDRHRIATGPEYLALLSAGAAQDILRAGVSAIGDCGAQNGITIPIRDAIAGGHIVGPRIFACGPAITTTAGHGDYIGISAVANNADDLRAQVRLWVRNGADFIKIMATGGGTDPATNRRRAQYSEAEMKAAVDDAHRLLKRVVVHANGTEGIRNSVRAGADVVAHCNWLGVADGTIDFDEGIVRRMADQGVMVDLNMGGALRPLIPLEGRIQEWHKPSESPRFRWDMMVRMEELGVRVYVTSDAAGRKVATYPAQICELVEKADVSPLHLIQMATQLPAEGMGVGKHLGTLEAGKVADLIAVDGDPTVDVRALTRVALVVQAGRLAVTDGRIGAPGPLKLPSELPALL